MKFDVELSKTDVVWIRSLYKLNRQWVDQGQLLEMVNAPSIASIITWMRHQSTNKIRGKTCNGECAATVVQTYMYDPKVDRIYFCISDHIEDGGKPLK